MGDVTDGVVSTLKQHINAHWELLRSVECNMANTSDTDYSSDTDISYSSNVSVPGTPDADMVTPYRFEPVVQQEDIAQQEQLQQPIPIEQDIQRLQNVEWCSCFNCVPMATVAESVCCKEIDKVEEKASELACIISHEGFEPVCLNQWVLQTAYFGYRQAHGHYEEEEVHKRYRYTAYRQFVRWCFGFLGKKIRVPLPSCVVNRIHEEFPSIDYEGFHEHPDYPGLN